MPKLPNTRLDQRERAEASVADRNPWKDGKDHVINLTSDQKMQIIARWDQAQNKFIFRTPASPPNPKFAKSSAELKDMADELKRKTTAGIATWQDRDAFFKEVIRHNIQNSIDSGQDVPVTKHVGLPKSDGAVKEELPPLPDDSARIDVEFKQEDILTRAKNLSIAGNSVCLLNPMNEQVVGGGAFDGAPNFEESLFRVGRNYPLSMLAKCMAANNLTPAGYNGARRPTYTRNHVNDEAAFITTGVTIDKKILQFLPAGARVGEEPGWYYHGYEELPSDQQFQVNIVGNASIPLSDPADTIKHEAIIRKKIEAQLFAMAKNGTTHALLADFGCGGFKNDPKLIAKWYAEAIHKGQYDKRFQHIEFDILGPNFDVFQKAYLDRTQQLRQEEQLAATSTPIASPTHAMAQVPHPVQAIVTDSRSHSKSEAQPRKQNILIQILSFLWRIITAPFRALFKLFRSAYSSSAPKNGEDQDLPSPVIVEQTDSSLALPIRHYAPTTPPAVLHSVGKTEVVAAGKTTASDDLLSGDFSAELDKKGPIISWVTDTNINKRGQKVALCQFQTEEAAKDFVKQWTVRGTPPLIPQKNMVGGFSVYLGEARIRWALKEGTPEQQISASKLIENKSQYEQGMRTQIEARIASHTAVDRSQDRPRRARNS